MEETRVSRYKEYRQSFIKEGSIVSDAQTEEKEEKSSTTSTLPIDEVISAVQNEEKEMVFSSNARKIHKIKLIIKISIAAIIVVGLIILGIFAWGKF